MEKAVNRVLEAWKSWEDKQTQMEKVAGSGTEEAAVIRRLKLEHFQKARNLLAGNLRKDEQPFLPLMNATIRKLEKQVYPNILARLFFRLKNSLFDAPAQLKASETERRENIEGLKAELVKAGFKDFAVRLEERLDPQSARHSIALSSQLDQKRSLDVNLIFEKDANDQFKFSAIAATLKDQQGKQPERAFQFHMNEWPGLKAAHVKNLLEGRAVRQDFTDISGRANSQWLELPETGTQLKRYTQDYGYNLAKLLHDPRLGPLQSPSGMDSLIGKLEQGHVIPVKWAHANGQELVYIKADPAGGGISMTDSTQKAVRPEQLNQKLENRQEKQQAVIKQLHQPQEIKQQRKRSRGINH